MTADRPPAREELGDGRVRALARALYDAWVPEVTSDHGAKSYEDHEGYFERQADALAPLLAEWSALDRAAAWDEGYDAGADSMTPDHPGSGNPYRADEIGPRA